MPRAKKSNRSDGRYEIRRTIGYTADGERISKSFYGKDKDEAIRKYIEFTEAAERKRIEQKNITFAEWTDKWLYTFKQPDVKTTTFSTTYERPCKLHILPYFKDRLIKDITQLDIKEFTNFNCKFRFETDPIAVFVLFVHVFKNSHATDKLIVIFFYSLTA